MKGCQGPPDRKGLSRACPREKMNTLSAKHRYFGVDVDTPGNPKLTGNLMLCQLADEIGQCCLLI